MVAITPARLCNEGNGPCQMRRHVAPSVNPGQVSMAPGRSVGSAVMSVETVPVTSLHSPSAQVPAVSGAVEALVTPARVPPTTALVSFTGAERERSYQYTWPSLEVTIATAFVSIRPADGCRRMSGMSDVVGQPLGTTRPLVNLKLPDAGA